MNRDQCYWLIRRWRSANRFTSGCQTERRRTNSSFNLTVQSVQSFRHNLVLTLLRDKWNLFPARTVYVLWRKLWRQGLHSCRFVFNTGWLRSSKQQSHEFISCLFIGRSRGNLSTCQIRAFGSARRAVKTNLIALWVMDFMGPFYSLEIKEASDV